MRAAALAVKAAGREATAYRMRGERYVILCPVHARGAFEVDGVRVCGSGSARHRLARWWIFDQHLQRVTGEASEERGHVRQIDRPLREVPRLDLATVSMTERERRDQAQSQVPLPSEPVVRDMKARVDAVRALMRRTRPAGVSAARPVGTIPEEEPMENEKPPKDKPVKARATKGRRVVGPPERKAALRQAKLGVGGAVLLVRLEHHAGREATAYRVRWELLVGKRKQQAFAAVRPSEAEGRKAFDQHVASAREEGWFDLVISDGPGRPIELKPVPAPPASEGSR